MARPWPLLVCALTACALLFVSVTDATARRNRPKLDRTPPAAPTGLAATAGNGQVALDWKDNSESDLDHYNVYRGGTKVASVTPSAYTNTGLTNGTAYSYYVTAVDHAGNVSAPSSTVTATPTSGTTPPLSGGGLLSTCSAQPFCGDYETGNFSQWWQHQWSINNPDQGSSYTVNNVGNSTATIVTSPVAQGRYASKFQVFPTTGTNANDRAEALLTQAQSGGYPGQDWYYGWWTYFPGPSQSWWSNGGAWNDITQFQSTDSSGGWMYLGVDATSASPALYITGGGLGKRILSQPLQYDHWYHFVFHAKWSTDPAVGYSELWLDGAKVVPLTYGQTLKNQTTPANPAFTAPGMHVSQGIYRGASSFTNTVIHDGFCRAASYAAAAAC